MPRAIRLPFLKLKPLEITEVSFDGTRMYLRWHGPSHLRKPSKKAVAEGQRLLRRAMRGVNLPEEPMKLETMYFVQE